MGLSSTSPFHLMKAKMISTYPWEGPGLPWEAHQWLGWGFCLLLYTFGALPPTVYSRSPRPSLWSAR